MSSNISNSATAVSSLVKPNSSSSTSSAAAGVISQIQGQAGTISADNANLVLLEAQLSDAQDTLSNDQNQLAQLQKNPPDPKNKDATSAYNAQVSALQGKIAQDQSVVNTARANVTQQQGVLATESGKMNELVTQALPQAQAKDSAAQRAVQQQAQQTEEEQEQAAQELQQEQQAQTMQAQQLQAQSGTNQVAAPPPPVSADKIAGLSAQQSNAVAFSRSYGPGHDGGSLTIGGDEPVGSAGGTNTD